jgi:osmotically-inducible protein OsmY
MNPKAHFGAALVATLVLVTLAPAAARAANVETVDLTPKFQAAGLKVDGLRAVEVGGIVVLRGRTDSAESAAEAGTLAQSLGYRRVANLIQVVEPPDDQAIERLVERQLALHRSLDGCQFRIDSDRGVVHLAGKVQYELQKDVAIEVARQVDGVRGVKADLQR